MQVNARDYLEMEIGKAMQSLNVTLASDDKFRDFYMSMFMPKDMRAPDIEEMRAKLEKSMVPMNAIAKAFRNNTRRSREFKSMHELRKSGEISKADLDVGTMTNFATITGGQTLGYVSLDTQMARGTVRPNSFTLYQSLHKSAAYQVVDFWPYASDTGGGLPGTAFQGFGNVASGSLSTSAGNYNLNTITLKLAVNGRAITTALAAQNSYVDVTQQENINAALTVLESENWTCYWGNPTYFPNQFQGISGQIPTSNVFDFQAWYNANASAQGWSNAQALFNLIYEASAQITSYNQYGRITHAFMTPITAGSLQGLVTTLLNNIVNNLTPTQERMHGVVVDGDLQGIRTRYGEIQFPIDLFISAREKPAQAILYSNGSGSYASSAVTAPTSLSAIVASAAVSGSAWTAAYAGAAGITGASGVYSYAVAACDSSMNESVLTYIASGAGPTSGLAVSGVIANGAVTLTITPNGSSAQAFRVYRSGLGYCPGIVGQPASGAVNPASYRFIGAVLASGSSTVTFIDLNTKIPGSETIFLLDMDENDHAIDFRYLLPLTKIELFAQNLFMPWAVCMIGALRLRIAKFHGQINNFVPDSPVFAPLSPNPNAT